MSIYIWIQSAHHVGHIQIDERIYSTRIVYNEKKSFTCQILRKPQLYTAINVNKHFGYGIAIIMIGGFLVHTGLRLDLPEIILNVMKNTKQRVLRSVCHIYWIGNIFKTQMICNF